MNTLVEHHAQATEAASIATSGVPSEYQSQSTDVLHIISQSFGIDEARQLTLQSQTRPVASDTRVFVIFTSSMTSQAQNALLKLFEDPPSTAQFFLVTPSLSGLLPTLRSRLHIFASEVAPVPGVAEDFFVQPLSEQLNEIADRAKNKDQAWIDSVVLTAYEKTSTSDASVRASMLFVAEHIGAPGASKKMLLEELALSLHRK